MWLKKPNPGLTRYLLRLPGRLRNLVGLINGHFPLNKHLHNTGLIDEPISIAGRMENESGFHLLCDCLSLISLRMRTFSKPILSVEEYERRMSLHCCDLRWQVADSLWLLEFLWTLLLFLLSYSICLSIFSFWSFNFSYVWCKLGPICDPRVKALSHPSNYELQIPFLGTEGLLSPFWPPKV
jgi:hypothetical protein